jgi:hypothetical protein
MKSLAINARNTKIVMAAITCLNLYYFFSIPFLGVLTIMLMVLFGIITGAMSFGFLIDEENNVAGKLSHIFAIGGGIFMSAFLMLTNYNALTDLTQLTAYAEMDTKIVSNQTVISTLSEYKKGDPARVMLKQFFLTSPHSTVFVWNKVAQRAKYLSDLYTSKELPVHAAAPRYGFLHTTDSVMGNTVGSRTNKLPERMSIYGFIKLRRQGYTVRYANKVVERVAEVVQGKSAILNNVSEYIELLHSINAPRNPVGEMKTVAEMAKQLDIKTNLPDLINANLGRNLSASAILNSELTVHKKSAKPLPH